MGKFSENSAGIAGAFSQSPIPYPALIPLSAVAAIPGEPVKICRCGNAGVSRLKTGWGARVFAVRQKGAQEPLGSFFCFNFCEPPHVLSTQAFLYKYISTITC
ncbi:hypothetical protein CFPG_P4-4 (plasmid) [Candidatus Azobacteroides pseudotrichonymphae genomovar. CFP2]|uniref:Uncharacterized protein n=1 Tax=Azobacteroides pseudotrichonymphae genomovar. CFP2 TaxID=511995 RepID=B6YSE3_AZOPC|nr:hypothetical protein CFPG_P4-4 [Candidatus Azobacteroides pseudotrichonymphae genomovar. CFP2]